MSHSQNLNTSKKPTIQCVFVKISCILYTYNNSETTSFHFVNSKLKPTMTYNKCWYKCTSWAWLKLCCQLILFKLIVVFVVLYNFCKVFPHKTQTKVVWCDEINADLCKLYGIIYYIAGFYASTFLMSHICTLQS